MLKKFMALMALLIILLLNSGCLDLHLEMDVDFPTKMFKEARAEISAIHQKDPMRKGPVSKINFMVYVGEERTLVRFALPKDKIPKDLSEVSFLDKKDIKELSEKCKDLTKPGNLEKMGPGLLVEIDVADGNVHLLAWLD